MEITPFTEFAPPRLARTHPNGKDKTMRTFLFVLALLVFIGTANAQYPPIQLSGLTSGTSWTVAYAYANSLNDTSKSIPMGGRYAVATVSFEAHDSVSVIMYYQPSYDNGVTWGERIAIGSAHTVGRAGSAGTGTPTASYPDVFGWELPAIAKAAQQIRLIIAFEATANGVTTPASSTALIVTP
jgi:hypothetical protein